MEVFDMRFKETQFISLVNQKGGCGKTTTTVGLSVAFNRLGYSVCVVDLDPQRNTTKNFKADFSIDPKTGKPVYSIADAILNQIPAKQIAIDVHDNNGARLSIIPGNQNLNSVMHRLELGLQQKIAEGAVENVDAIDIRNGFPYLLKYSLDSLSGHYDVVIMDTGPSMDFLMTSALVSSGWYIIPTFISAYDFEGLELLWKTVAKIKEKYNEDLKFAGILIGNYDSATVLDKQAVDYLKNKFGEAGVFRSLIKRSVRFRQATFDKISIFESELDGVDGLRTQFTELAKEMITRGSAHSASATGTPLPAQVKSLTEQGIANG